MTDKNHWDDLDDETFDHYLREIIDERPAAHLLTIAGVYEILREELNNDVLQRWAEKNGRDLDTGAPLGDDDETSDI